ncbi:MAG: hypothetical protein P8X62_03470 [Flavobacteriaceae bacterium]
MKKIIKNLWVLGIILLASCSNSDDSGDPGVSPDVNFNFNFTHYWDDTNVTNLDFNTIQFTNANGEELSIEKLRYLISKITFQNSDGTTTVIDGYNLVDVTNNTNLSFSPEIQIPKGTYNNVSFTFGFDNEDNIDGAYPDLNTANWNVPAMLGGGYHFMQLEGKFIDNTDAEVGYQYHAIRAVDNSDPNNLQFQDTFITVDLGSVTIENNITFNINMNIAEWFKNPVQWDLNTLHTMLMPNFGAQILMYNNGKDVFSLGSITQ